MPVSLSLQEAALFNTLSELLADETSIEMDSLRVRVGSQGFELGRTYLSLRSLDLVEEYLTRPGFFRRLFGAQPKRYVSLTETGRAFARTGSMTAATETPDPAPDEPQTRAAHQPEDAQGAPSKPKPAPAASRKKPRAATTPTTTDFTEALGGTPLEHLTPTSDAIRLEGLAEMLGLIGFEITPAGQMLAAKRWAEGRRDSEVALEILLVAVAHAAQLDALGMARLDRTVAGLFFKEVEKEFAQLATAGELSADYLAGTLETVFAILGTAEAAQAPLATILQDPVLGAAPPAICPDDFYQATNPETD